MKIAKIVNNNDDNTNRDTRFDNSREAVQ